MTVTWFTIFNIKYNIKTLRVPFTGYWSVYKSHTDVGTDNYCKVALHYVAQN